MKHALLLLVFASALTACSTTRVPLTYQPSSAKVDAAENAQPVVIGSIRDERGESPTWLGAIRGGYGNPLKYLEADRPVAEMVKAALTQGLVARHYAMPATGATREVAGVIRELGCNQYVNRTADVRIDIEVFDAKSGQQRLARTYTVSESEFTAASGVFGSVDDLRGMAEKALRDVVDKALDDTAMRNALK